MNNYISGKSDSLSDERLMLSFYGGNDSAFESLVERYRPRFMIFARKQTANKADAEDAVQNTFISVYKTIFNESARYSPEDSRGATVSTWFYRILGNKLMDYHRARKKTREVILMSLDDVPENHGDDHEYDNFHNFLGSDKDARQMDSRLELRYILGIAEKLPPIYREVFELDMRGYTYRQSAEMLQLVSGTHKSRLFRARGGIRNIIRNNGRGKIRIA